MTTSTGTASRGRKEKHPKKRRTGIGSLERQKGICSGLSPVGRLTEDFNAIQMEPYVAYVFHWTKYKGEAY